MMEMQETLRKLRPLIGGRADRIWLAYLAEDHRGRQELEGAVQLLAAKRLGTGIMNPEVPLSAPPREVASGPYVLGEVAYAGRPLHPFGLREEEWIQHAAIFGRSGAGKTNTVFLVIENFLRQQKPFLIFDWKRNYRDLLAVRPEEILVYTAGRGIVPFVFNPLIPPEGTDASVWLKKLIEIIAHAYYLGEGVMFLLQEALDAVYQEFGLYKGLGPERYPTFVDALGWLEAQPVKGRKALWMDSALRGIKSVCFGHMGRVVNTGVQPNLAALLQKNVILELDGLTNADKTFLTEALLLWIHHYRLAEGSRETFKHAIIIEEAHHILLKRSGTAGGGEALTDTILREIRELGEAVVLVDQHPSLISIPAMGNTYTTITMNLKHASDVSAAGAAMLMKDEEREVLGRLPIGSAVVKLQGRWTEPFLIRIPHREIPKGAIEDARLAELMAERDFLAASREEDEEGATAQDEPDKTEESEAREGGQVSKREETFLLDIIERPLCGSVERYRGLGLSRRKGNDLRESLIAKGLIRPVSIPTRSGQTVLLELTSQGSGVLRSLGHEAGRAARRESLEHDYWKRAAARKLEGEGWRTKIEEPVNGYADILAEKDGQRMAVEIETGKSDWRANVRKNLSAGIKEILIIATANEVRDQIQVKLEEEEYEGRVRIELAQEFL